MLEKRTQLFVLKRNGKCGDEKQCWARTPFFSSRHRGVRHFLNLCANAPPRYLILAPPRHNLGGKNSRHQKYCCTKPYLSKIIVEWVYRSSMAEHFITKCTCLLSLVSLLLSHVSCILSLVCLCLLSVIFCLLSHVSCLLSSVSCHLSLGTCLLIIIIYLSTTIQKTLLRVKLILWYDRYNFLYLLNTVVADWTAGIGQCALFSPRVLSPVSYLLSFVSCLMYHVSRLLFHIFCILSHISCLTSLVSCRL